MTGTLRSDGGFDQGAAVGTKALNGSENYEGHRISKTWGRTAWVRTLRRFKADSVS